ncbi:MAG: K+/H+ antiporter subunit F [Casimicrobiaceae bacterium]
MITAAILPYVITAFALAMLLNLWRALKGPSLPDRVLALDTLYVNALSLLVLVGLLEGTSLYFEAALLIAMVGFVGTVVMCKFLLRTEVFR